MTVMTVKMSALLPAGVPGADLSSLVSFSWCLLYVLGV